MQGAMAVIKSCRLLCVCVFLCSPLSISLSDESLDMTNYSKASCDFENPCYWTNVEKSDFSLIWDYTDSWGDDYAFLDMEGKSSGEKGRLSSPWLPSLSTSLPTTENSQLTHQTQCRLQFKYSIGISDNCRLTLLLEDEDRITATNRSDNDDHGKVLWSSSQSIGDSYFSDVQSVDIPCLHTRKYRMTFEGQKLTNGPCGQSTWFNPDNNRIKLDNVFLTWPTDDPTTTTTTPDPTEDYDSDDLSGDVDDDNFENEDADLASTLSSTPSTTTSRTSESNDLTTTDNDSGFSYYTTAPASIHGVSHHDDSDKIDLVSGSDSTDDIIISDVDSPMETQTHSIDPSSSSSARDIEDDDDFDDDIVDSGVTKHDDGHDENNDVITESTVDHVKNEDSHPSFGVTLREGKHEGEVERHRTKTSTATTRKTTTTTTAMTTTTMMSTKEQDDVLTDMVTKSVSVSESSDPTMMMFIGIIIAASVGVVVIIIVVVVTAIICHRRRKRRETIQKNSRSRNGDIISAVSLSKGDIFVISDPEVQNGDLRSHPHRHTPPVSVINTPTAPPPHHPPSQPSPVPPVIAGGPCASRTRHMVSSTDHNKLDIPNGHI